MQQLTCDKWFKWVPPHFHLSNWAKMAYVIFFPASNFVASYAATHLWQVVQMGPSPTELKWRMGYFFNFLQTVIWSAPIMPDWIKNATSLLPTLSVPYLCGDAPRLVLTLSPPYDLQYGWGGFWSMSVVPCAGLGLVHDYVSRLTQGRDKHPQVTS